MQFKLILSNSILNPKFTFFFGVSATLTVLNIPMLRFWNSVAVVTSGDCGLGPLRQLVESQPHR